MNERKVFQNSVTALPVQTGLTPQGLMVNAVEPQQRDEKMTLNFSLATPQGALAELEARVARGEVVPLAEQRTKYSPNAADTSALVSWLKAQGFETQVSADGVSVYATASVGQIEQSLGVKMVRVTKDGLTYTAAQNAPSMPADVGKGVHGIIGLQPFRHAHKHNRMRLPKRGNRASWGTTAGDRALGATASAGDTAGVTTVAAGQAPSPNIANAPPYLVQEILKAYNADGIPVTGKGQTIAILIDTFPSDSDLQTFWNRNQLSTTLQQIEKINVNGGHLPRREGEETLDAEWASGIAPDAKIRIYATGSLRFVDLDMGLDQILGDLPSQPEMRQLSISLGLGETFMAADEVTTQHEKFLRLAAAGVNVFVSSGDAGSNPDATGHSSTGPTQAEYESSDPAVIGVGGTSLTLATDGSVQDETAWASSGGGKSIFFLNRPPWQKGKGVPTGKERLVPDVSLAADPDTGAFLVLNGQVSQIGGTSWSAPVWAGFCALINEARSKAGKDPLPFLNPLIYPLMGTSCFRDIQSGSNGAFKAGAGYDLVTGIGVPNIKELIRSLSQ
jgi:kumamolisin